MTATSKNSPVEQKTETRRKRHSAASEPATYTVAEIAAACGVGIATVRRWIKGGRLATCKVGGRAYQCTVEAVRTCLETFEGRDVEPVIEALEHPSAAGGQGQETGRGAYTYGRIFAMLVKCGAVRKGEQLSQCAVSPSRNIGPSLVRAVREQSEDFKHMEANICNFMTDLTTKDMFIRTLSQEEQGYFWKGYYRQFGELEAEDQGEEEKTD